MIGSEDQSDQSTPPLTPQVLAPEPKYQPKCLARTGNAMAVSLDEKSARLIARSRISQLSEKIRECVLTSALPQKRLAWIRAAASSFRETVGDAVIAVQEEKRCMIAYAIEPRGDDNPGWMLITGFVFPFKKPHQYKDFCLAYLSAHSIARVMERMRDVEVLKVIVSELLVWTMLELLSNRGVENVIVPTANGYFTGRWDAELESFVLTTWLPDRLLTDRECARLAVLREAEHLLLTEKLDVE